MLSLFLTYLHTSFFSNQKFYEQEITKCIIVQETITYLSPLHPQKTTHKHVAFTVFLYRQKVSSSPESYSPKKMGFSRIL